MQRPHPGRPDKHGKQMDAQGGWRAVSEGEKQVEEPQEDIRDQGLMQLHEIFQHYRHIILMYNINDIIFQITKIVLKNLSHLLFLIYLQHIKC